MRKVLNIGAATWPSKGGGVERGQLIARNLIQQGWRVLHLKLDADRSSIRRSPAGEVLIGTNRRSLFGRIISALIVLRRLNPDVVIAHNNRAYLQSLIPCWMARVPLYLEVHNFRDGRVINLLASRIVYCAARRVIVLSESAASYLVRRYSYRGRVFVCPNGVEQRLLEREAVPPPLGAQLRLVYFGSYHDWQGVAVICDALLDLQAREHSGEVLCTFVGTGPLKGLVDETVARLGARNIRAVAFDWVSRIELDQLILDSDAILMPRLSTTGTETIVPLKAVEAVAYQRAVIASSVGGLAECLGDAAIYVKPGDSSDLSRCIAKVSESHFELRAVRDALVERRSTLMSWATAVERYHAAISG